MRYNSTEQSPKFPGEYNVSFDNLRTMMPLYFKWTGQKWIIPAFYQDEMLGTMYWYGENNS